MAAVVQRDEILTDLASESGLTARASTFDRRDLLRGVAERMPSGATVAQIEATADSCSAHPNVVTLVDPGVGPGLWDDRDPPATAR